jgi:glycerol-3-phosphate acyltransferase PlsY
VDIVVFLTTAAVAYLLGSIPTGYLAGKARGIDVRKVGSGNIGATNVFRILGKTAGIIVLLGDALKGWLAVAVAPKIFYRMFGPGNWNLEYLQIIASVVVILGHNYTCWLRFKGGKGIATSAGVLIALMPITFGVGLLAWLTAFFLTRYVSVASIAAAISLPFSAWLTHSSYALLVMVTILSALAIYKHKPNIERLLNGTENKIGRKKDPPGAIS